MYRSHVIYTEAMNLVLAIKNRPIFIANTWHYFIFNHFLTFLFITMEFNCSEHGSPSFKFIHPIAQCRFWNNDKIAPTWTPKHISYTNGFVCVMCVSVLDFVAIVFSRSIIMIQCIHHIHQFQTQHIVGPCLVWMLRKEAPIDVDVQGITQCQTH